MLQNQPLRKPREKTPGYRDLARRADGSQRHVLYAEDQASTRIVTEALLKRMGFAVVAVAHNFGLHAGMYLVDEGFVEFGAYDQRTIWQQLE